MQSRRPALCARFVVAFAIGVGAQACAERPSPPAPSTPTVVTAPTIAIERPSPTLAAQREVQPLSPTPYPPPAGFAWTTSTSPDGTWRARYGFMDGLDAPSPDAEHSLWSWSYSSLVIDSVVDQHSIQVVEDWAPYPVKCGTGVDFLGWSPDSAHAFAASYSPCAAGCSSPVGVTGRVYRIELASARTDDLWEPAPALGRTSLSPDGSWVAARQDGPQSETVFRMRLISTGDDPDRAATIDVHSTVFAERERISLHGPWSIEWLPDSAAVRFQYTIDVCASDEVHNGWLRYDLVTGTLVPDGPVSTGMP